MEEGTPSRTPGGFIGRLVSTPLKAVHSVVKSLTRASSSPNLAEAEEQDEQRELSSPVVVTV